MPKRGGAFVPIILYRYGEDSFNPITLCLRESPSCIYFIAASLSIEYCSAYNKSQHTICKHLSNAKYDIYTRNQTFSQYTRFIARTLLIAWGHSDFSPPDLVTILYSCCGQFSGKRLWAVFWAEKTFFIWTKYWAQVARTSPITCLCFLWFCYPKPPSGFPLVRLLSLPCFFPIFDTTTTWGRLFTFELYLRHAQT